MTSITINQSLIGIFLSRNALKMASSIAPPIHLANICANCWVYNWVQPDKSFLQQCKQCKVAQYCGIDCQKEHWKSCHKKHCKELVAIKVAWREGDPPIQLASHPVFPAIKMGGDTKENLVLLVMRVIRKMRQTGHPAFLADPAKGSLEQIWKKMAGENLKLIYTERRIYPSAACVGAGDCRELSNLIQHISFDETEDQLGLWNTLKLILDILVSYQFLVTANIFKNLHVSVPEELWQGVDKEVGLFPDIVEKIVEAFSSDQQVPTFQRLLEIVCGGSLSQACAICNKHIVVSEIGGLAFDLRHINPVWVHPYFPRMFVCREKFCVEQMNILLRPCLKWRVAVNTAIAKLKENRCDFCFKFSERVHR